MYMYIAEEKTFRISFSPHHVYGRPWRIAFDMIYVRIGKYNFIFLFLFQFPVLGILPSFGALENIHNYNALQRLPVKEAVGSYCTRN